MSIVCYWDMMRPPQYNWSSLHRYHDLHFQWTDLVLYFVYDLNSDNNDNDYDNNNNVINVAITKYTN